jgi:hypothetical protein
VDLVDSFADKSLETLDDLGVKRVVCLDLVHLLSCATDGTFVLFLGLHPQRDRGHKAVDHVEILQMIREHLVHLGKNLLHKQ